MRTDRDVTRIVRSWLDEGVTALPDRVLDAVLDRIPATPQRRAGRLARRFFAMNGWPRLAAVSAAVALGVVVGLALFTRGPNAGQGTESPSSTPTSTPAALDNLPLTVTLAAGTYAIDADFPVQVSVTLPGGWTHNRVSSRHVALSRADTVGYLSLSFMTVLNVYTSADPCEGQHPLAAPPVGPSVEDLVTALTHLPGTEAGTVSGVVIDGFEGRSFDLHVRHACSNLYPQRLWKPSSPEWDGFTAADSEQLRVYVIDARGQRIVFVTQYVEGGPNANRYKAELQAVVDSIHIAPRT